MILSLIPWSLFVAFVSGVAFLILVQVTIIYFFFFRNPSNQSNISTAPSVEGYTFPQQLYEFLAEKLGENNSEGTLLLNLLLQFWFRENRYDVNTLTALANRINVELTELLMNTPLGRIFNSLKIHDIELGSESPTISSVRLKDVDVNKELNTLNNFVFEFDVNYVGGFYTAIHALMKFNSNTAFVSVKVNKCIGRVRVEFTRLPYTYWCMSFLSPPELELVVESRLEGHSVPQLNRIIGIQLRRRINRKFVMPFYKIRSKPFLPTHNLINVKDDVSESVPHGKLHITVVSLSRIAKRQGDISCMLILDSSPWIEDVQSTTNHTYLLQIFKRSNKDISSLENRKLSTGSLLLDRNQDGLRQRLKSMTGQDDSGSLDESFRRKSFADASMLQQKSSSDILVRAESDDGTNIQQTKRIQFSELVLYNEQFKFVIGPTVRYLTILVWNHTNDGQPESMIGHVSIPLTNLIHPGIGRKRRIFYLNSPNQTKPILNLYRNMAYTSLATHPGFNCSLCYGDITLGVKFNSSSSSSPTASAPSLSSNESTPVSLSPTKNAKTPILLETTASLSCIDSEMILSVHEFDRMVITKPTKCEFCQKKIWLREASRCQKCNLICHKKCIAKCEKSSECRGYVSEDSLAEEDSIEVATQAISINPEITTTAPDNGGFAGSSKNKFSTFFANVKGMRRSGSTSSLAPPSNITVCYSQVHSLPQTPNHSPSLSRKSSVVMNDVKLFENEAMDDEIEKALNQLTTFPQSEQFLESVKSSGKKLCVDLPPNERQTRINEMIVKIKTVMDAEHTSASNFEEQKKLTSNVDELTKLSFQIGKCEERLQALSSLLLHCCSGLQDSHETSTSTTDILL